MSPRHPFPALEPEQRGGTENDPGKALQHAGEDIHHAGFCNAAALAMARLLQHLS